MSLKWECKIPTCEVTVMPSLGKGSRGFCVMQMLK